MRCPSIKNVDGVTMLANPFRCMFCLTNTGPFTRQEHLIPESLGNDDVILPPGYVCDDCNQYFGSAIEQKALAKAPFSVARVTQAIRNKKGHYPIVSGDGWFLQSSGFWDRCLLRSDPPHQNLWPCCNGQLVLNPKWGQSDLIVRFLLKIGLELLVLSRDVNPYAANFDAARLCARRGRNAKFWDFAYGLYPNRNDLVTSTRSDEIGPLETRQIYQWDMGVMESGDVMFSFIYETMIFAVNLSKPSALEYILGFNLRNVYSVHSRWSLS
jgi:hypothetical protein